jgi:hypothetical protein
MNYTRIRTSLAVVAAAFSVAAATAPVVSTASAMNNTGKFQRWLKARNHAVTCANLQTVSNAESDAAADAHAAGNDAASREHSRNADQAYETAKAAHCSWAG